MNKIFELKIGERVFKLNFNIIFGEQLAKVLKLEEAMPEHIMKGLLDLNAKSSFLMYKAIIHCGILGNDYVTGYTESISVEEVGALIVDCSAEQLKEIFDSVALNLGFDFSAEVEVQTEKKN